MEYQERMTSHLETCPLVIVCCSNSGCTAETSRCEVSTHRSTCDCELVSCKYTEAGCKERPPRKDLKKHAYEEDAQHHLQILSESFLRQKKEISILTRKYTPFTFKVIGFTQKKRGNAISYCPPFYTSPSGYKMCARVDANGHGDAKETHISVFVHLMKGDNDDSLTWPFTGTVTFELLNQLEDKNHHKRTVTFPADDRYS